MSGLALSQIAFEASMEISGPLAGSSDQRAWGPRAPRRADLLLGLAGQPPPPALPALGLREVTPLGWAIKGELLEVPD